MPAPGKKPTRRDLLLMIGDLQDIIGAIGAASMNDRSTDRAKLIQDLVERGMKLCLLARSYDPPLEGKWP